MGPKPFMFTACMERAVQVLTVLVGVVVHSLVPSRIAQQQPEREAQLEAVQNRRMRCRDGQLGRKQVIDVRGASGFDASDGRMKIGHQKVFPKECERARKRARRMNARCGSRSESGRQQMSRRPRVWLDGVGNGDLCGSEAQLVKRAEAYTSGVTGAIPRNGVIMCIIGDSFREWTREATLARKSHARQVHSGLRGSPAWR